MFNDIIQYILGLGAAIFLPVIMIILGLCVKMKVKKAIIAGITLGIAFTGMNVVLGFMFNSISPAAQALSQRTGLELTAIDVGWSPISAIFWAWPFALFMFPLQIIINLIMLAFNFTSCLNVDLWNVWTKIFTGAITARISGSILLGFVAAAIQVILELITGDLLKERCYEATGIPGVTSPHAMFLQAPYLALINRILDYVPGINKVNIDAAELKKRIGIFGENSVMGFIVGGLIAFLAGYSIKDILITAMSVATAMVLFPTVAKFFMQALAPIADATGSFMKSKFKGRDFYIGLDWPFLAGCSEIWVVAIILVPIELILAVVLSQMGLNKLIPLASVLNICVCAPALLIARKNLVRMFLMCLIATPSYLIIGSKFAPAITQMAIDTNTFQVPASGQLISWMMPEAPEFRWFIANAFSGDIGGIIGIIIFLVLFIWYYFYMKKTNIQIEKK
ncbi:PTS galactitol transporter subunit IIC [Pectinatus frisingensis]|uniref:PTS galactitol transporter subunit IIC n=1 Tax=Pectinatus frisingensis TaxID=865 RepID=UPI003D80172A